MSVHPIIRQIIDRDCHVSMSARSVSRHVISKLKGGYLAFRRLPRRERRILIADCIRQHQANLQLYRTVMNGTSGPRPKGQPRSDVALAFSNELSGKELCLLMRRHKVTIQALSFRTGISQKRIREARAVGLNDGIAVRDWIQAITGIDPGPIPEKYRIRNPTEETTCGYCGSPMFVGEDAFEYVIEVFCSRHCSRRSRGWE